MKLLILLLTLVFCSISIQAQNTELFAGATFVRSDPNFRSPSFRFDRTTDQWGFNGAFTGYFGDRPVGLTVDVGGSWQGGGDDSSLVTVMAGPTVKARGHRLQPFGRGLIGAGRTALKNQQLSFNFDRQTTGLAYGFGGGLDINVSDRFAIRAFQADYISTRIDHKNVSYLQAGVGVVVRF